MFVFVTGKNEIKLFSGLGDVYRFRRSLITVIHR